MALALGVKSGGDIIGDPWRMNHKAYLTKLAVRKSRVTAVANALLDLSWREALVAGARLALRGPQLPSELLHPEPRIPKHDDLTSQQHRSRRRRLSDRNLPNPHF